MNFVNRDLLGKTTEFKRKFENVILRGRDASSTEKEQMLAEQMLKEVVACGMWHVACAGVAVVYA